MFNESNKTRDAFRFSLGGMLARNPVVVAPAIADDRLTRVWDERLSRAPEDQPDTALEIENLLARYFAPGRCRAA